MTLSNSVEWDQSKFNAALKAKLDTLSRDKVPASINKTSFWVAFRAMQETPKKTPFEIEASVNKEVTATNKEGETRTIPLLWVLASKAIGKNWPEQKMMRGINNKRQVSALKAYLKAIKAKAKIILGSRKRASGFLRAGWLSVVKDLGKYARGAGSVSFATTGARIVGQPKGNAVIAVAGMQPTATITNSATAKSDRVNGLIKFGGPALERAMEFERKGIIERLDKDTQDILNGKID